MSNSMCFHGSRFILEKENNACLACIAERLTAERDDLQVERDRLATELAATRELMNAYNLGGWTDAVAPMKRALAAEAERDRLTAALNLWLEWAGWNDKERTDRYPLVRSSYAALQENRDESK